MLMGFSVSLHPLILLQIYAKMSTIETEISQRPRALKEHPMTPKTDHHIYLVLHPNHSLVASQLPADLFAKHYVQGSSRFFEGRLIFAELDPDWRNPYFDFDTAIAGLIPHPDGRPKATKFIKNYRTLEHVDLSAIGKLYFCNASGDFIAMESSTLDVASSCDQMRIILEINPIRFMVLTKLNLGAYGAFITDSKNPEGAPSMFFTQLEFSIDDFMEEFDENPFLTSVVPGIHPGRLHESVLELRNTIGKKVKGLSLDCPIDKISYKMLKGGFVFAKGSETKFYPLIGAEEIDKTNAKFWQVM